jgi:hypothetical protein
VFERIDQIRVVGPYASIEHGDGNAVTPNATPAHSIGLDLRHAVRERWLGWLIGVDA